MNTKSKKPPKFELKFRSAKKIRTLRELGRACTTIGTALIPVAVAYYVSSRSTTGLSLMVIAGGILIVIGSYCMGLSEDWATESKAAGSVLY